MNVLTAMLLCLASASDSSSIYRTLEEFSNRVSTQLAQAEQTFSQQMQKCKLENQYRSEQLKAAKFELELAKAEFDSCDSSLSITQQKLTKYKNHYNFAMETIAKLQKFRAIELNVKAKTNEVSQLLKETLSYIEEDSKNLETKALELLQDSETFELLQATQSSKESGAVEALQRSLETKDSVSSSINSLLQKSLSVVEAFKTSLSSNKNYLEDHMTYLNLCKETQYQLIFIATDKELRNKSLFGLGISTCEDWKQEFQSLSQLYKEELGILSKVLEISQVRFGI